MKKEAIEEGLVKAPMTKQVSKREPSTKVILDL